MQDTYRLVVRRGPQPNQTYELNKDITTLGRDITNDIVINDREVSRHHMRLTRGADGFTIEDLGSTNGTFVNGKRLSGVTSLQNGDIIGLGETVTLAFELSRGQSNLASSPPPAPMTSRNESPSPVVPVSPPPSVSTPDPSPYQPQSASYQPEAEAPSYYTPSAQSGYGGNPPTGYDYDPYVIREDEGGGALRYFLFGCIGLLLLCCCVTVLGLVVIDQLNYWCDVPVVSDVVQALGLQTCQ